MQSLLSRAKNVLLHPNIVWNDIEKEKGLREPLQYALFLGVIGSVLVTGMDIATDQRELADALVPFLIGAVIPLVGVVVYSLFMLFAASLLKINLRYDTALRIVAYSSTPNALFTAFLGGFEGLWYLYLFLVGQKKLLHLSSGKNAALFFLALVPPVLLTVLAVYLFAQYGSFGA